MMLARAGPKPTIRAKKRHFIGFKPFVIAENANKTRNPIMSNFRHIFNSRKISERNDAPHMAGERIFRGDQMLFHQYTVIENKCAVYKQYIRIIKANIMLKVGWMYISCICNSYFSETVYKIRYKAAAE